MGAIGLLTVKYTDVVIMGFKAFIYLAKKNVGKQKFAYQGLIPG